MSDEENAGLVIKTGVEQMFAPLHRLLDQLLGPAATEVGLTLGDSVKVWRLKRQIRLLEEVKRLIEHSGKVVKPVATRLFFPVLEAASIEDDDDLQTRWAALLANEATNAGSVHPSYIDILRQLAPDDARLLDRLCDTSERTKSRKLTRGMLAWSENEQSLENLVRVGLIQSEYAMNEGTLGVLAGHAFVLPSGLDSCYLLTDFTVKFVRTCRAPDPIP